MRGKQVVKQDGGGKNARTEIWECSIVSSGVSLKVLCLVIRDLDSLNGYSVGWVRWKGQGPY